MSLIFYAGSVYSSVYGLAGQKELDKLFKALRIGREYRKDVGHPVNEHIIVPATKVPGLPARGVSTVDRDEFDAIQHEKRQGKDGNVSRALIVEYADDDEDDHHVYNRRRGEAARAARRKKAAQRDAVFAVEVR